MNTMKKLLLLLVLFMLATPAFAWFDNSSKARINASIVSGAETSFVFPASINTAGLTDSCSSPYFVNASDNALLNFYLENGTCSLNNNTVWWVVPETLNNGNNSFKMYFNQTVQTFNQTDYPWNPAGLVYWFHFDSGGTSQRNAVPNQNGTLSGATASINNGYWGRGQFTNHGAVGTGTTTNWTSSLFNNQNVSIEMWVYLNDSGQSSLFGYTSSNCELSGAVGQSVAGSLRFYAGNAGATVFDNIAAFYANITSGQWYYFVFTYDGTLARIYINGTLGTSYASGATKTLCITDNNLTFGSGSSGGLVAIQGFEDEIRVWNTNISSSYIADVWNTRNGAVFDGIEQFPATPPNITVQSPANTTYPSGSNVNLNYTIVKGTNDIDKCWLIKDATPNSTLPNCANSTMTGLTDGSHNVQVCINDTSGNIGCSSTIYFMEFTPVSPSVTIQSPSGSYGLSATPNINYTLVKGTYTIDKCWYRLDENATNISLAGCTNSSISSQSQGQHTIYILVNDTQGNTGIVGRNFTFTAAITGNVPVSAINILLLIPMLVALGTIVLLWISISKGAMMEALIIAVIGIVAVIVSYGLVAAM